jgi:hypothetical protein
MVYKIRKKICTAFSPSVIIFQPSIRIWFIIIQVDEIGRDVMHLNCRGMCNMTEVLHYKLLDGFNILKEKKILIVGQLEMNKSKSY